MSNLERLNVINWLNTVLVLLNLIIIYVLAIIHTRTGMTINAIVIVFKFVKINFRFV